MGKKSKKGQNKGKGQHYGKGKKNPASQRKKQTNPIKTNKIVEPESMSQNDLEPKIDVEVPLVDDAPKNDGVKEVEDGENLENILEEKVDPEPTIETKNNTFDEKGEEDTKIETQLEPESLEDEKEIEIASKASIPAGLEAFFPQMSESQITLSSALCSPPTNQCHLFEKWSDESSSASDKKALIEQLERMDSSYPNGGLVAYVANAKKLLENSRKGVNPLEGWSPSVPTGETFDLRTEEYNTFESLGSSEMGKCGFVLVAGGLGERLGYSNIKLGLPTELATETSYIQYYIEIILAIQSRYANPNVKLPLCIMVSNDTSSGTLKILKENNNFGMDDSQITIVQQGDGVPALMDNDATIALDPSNPYKVQAKPHGHGDIHALLYSNGVAKDWAKNGIDWLLFFQDTNGLAFHTLPLALGVSAKLGLIMNSITVPRKAKQAIGAIAKLKKTTGEERTINIEYNQLDPLLRATTFPDGDVNDTNTGFSPFPGNINQLIFKIDSYNDALETTKGAMPEFVNPKYKNEDKTIFKKPTRLECMMQDFPTILNGDMAKQVGFTSIPADICFSPVKNATVDGVALQAKGTQPGAAASGEADQYTAIRKILKSIGCQINDAPPVTFSGITIVPGPDIVLKPSFVVSPFEYPMKFPFPSSVKVSSRSSLVISGHGVIVESLDLDGALVIECEEGASGVIRDLVVKNKGWEKVPDDTSDIEVIKMRGYHLNKIETKNIIFRKDGSVEGYCIPEEDNVNDAIPKAIAEAVIETNKTSDVESNTELKNLNLSKPVSSEIEPEHNECCVIS